MGQKLNGQFDTNGWIGYWLISKITLTLWYHYNVTIEPLT